MKELREKNDRDLAKHVAEKREDLRALRFKASGSGMRDARAIRTTRREIARALTELSSRRQELPTDNA